MQTGHKHVSRPEGLPIMGHYGICPSCATYKYLNGTICKTCSYVIGKCLVCKREVKIYVDDLCYLCYQDRQVKVKVEELEFFFKPLNHYNRQLFQLYLSYIKRYRLFYIHVKITKDLIDVLQKDAIRTIKTWNDILKLKDCYTIFQKPNKKQGCVFIKIGNMLSELGVLPPREDNLDSQITNLMKIFLVKDIEVFFQSLQKTNMAKESILHYLRSLRELEKFSVQELGINSLLLLNRFHLRQFFDKIQNWHYKIKERCFLKLNVFINGHFLKKSFLKTHVQNYNGVAQQANYLFVQNISY